MGGDVRISFANSADEKPIRSVGAWRKISAVSLFDLVGALFSVPIMDWEIREDALKRIEMN